MTSFLIIDDHPLFRDALGNAIRLAHTDARILEAMSTFGSRGWAQIMSAKGRGCVKRDRAKDAQNCFLNCLLLTEVASAIGFRIDEIETEILHASSTLEFSHRLGQNRKLGHV